MRKQPVLLTILTLFIFFLVACGGNNVTTAVDYLNAINERDFDAAAALACEERADEIIDGLLSVSPEERQSIEFERVSCSQQAGDEVLCRFTIVQVETEINNEDTVFEEDRSVVFEMEDGRVCGFHEEVAN